MIESTTLEGDAVQLARFAACGLHNGSQLTVVVSEALKLLQLMWLQCIVIRGPVGVVCGRFGPGLGRRPQINRKRLRPDLGQPPIAATLEALDESAAKNLTDVEVAAFVRDFGAGCQELHSIDLSGCTQVSDEGLRVLSTNCPKMEHIDLSGCEISDNGLRALIAGCLNLQHVNLAECKISDEGLRTLSTGCRLAAPQPCLLRAFGGIE